jgi:hypothetical protein
MGKAKSISRKITAKPASKADAAITVLHEQLAKFRRLASFYAPGTPGRPGRNYDERLFVLYSKLVIEIARTLVGFEVAKPAAAPATLQAAISFEANVSVGQRDAPTVDFEAMSDADLIRWYRARIAGSTEADLAASFVPSAPVPALSASSAPVAAERPPEVAVTRAPVEADEPTEEPVLEPVISEPIAAPRPAAKRATSQVVRFRPGEPGSPFVPGQPAPPLRAVGTDPPVNSPEWCRRESHKMHVLAEEAARERGPNFAEQLSMCRAMFPKRR